MEQNSFAEGQNQQGNTTQTVSQSQPAIAPQAPSQTEKMLSQSEVNGIIGRTKAEAEERGRQRALQEMNTSAPANTVSQPSLIGGITPEDVRRTVAEEIKAFKAQDEQKQFTEQGQKILNELVTKFQSAESKYEDFRQKVTPYFNERNGVAFSLANQFENTADIAYEFASRPSTLTEISSAFDKGGVQAAYQKVAELSQSIKLNQAAATVKTPNEPLSQIKSSPVGSDDGSLSVSDIIAQYKKKH